MLLHLGSKGFAICRGFMALPDLFPFEKLVPVCTALEITGCSQYFPHTKPHGNLPVLQHLKKVFPGIFKGSEKHIVKIIISFFRGGNLRCLEGYLFPSAKQNPGCFRTGKRQGIFPQTFKFFDVPRIFPTGVAKHSFSNLAVDVAKAVLI